MIILTTGKSISLKLKMRIFANLHVFIKGEVNFHIL